MKRSFFVVLGAAIAATGLQFFLLPNHLIDGGVTGISIIISHITGIPLGVFLVILNIPFIVLAHKRLGNGSVWLSALGISILALLTSVHVQASATQTPILAAIFGGVILGVGAGIVLRYGGMLDGSDTIALLIDRNTIFSVSEAILVINGSIITLAGFIFGWENAMYSLVAYYIVHKAVDLTVQGLDESRILWIVTTRPSEVGAAVSSIVDDPVTHVKHTGFGKKGAYAVMFIVLTRLDERKVQLAVRKIDRHAFMVMTDAHEPIGRISEHPLKK